MDRVGAVAAKCANDIDVSGEWSVSSAAGPPKEEACQGLVVKLSGHATDGDTHSAILPSLCVRPPLRMTKEHRHMAHIAVIGAGITGITTAYSLAARGYQGQRV